jgi:hypothetical protein
LPVTGLVDIQNADKKPVPQGFQNEGVYKAMTRPQKRTPTIFERVLHLNLISFANPILFECAVTHCSECEKAPSDERRER